MAEVSRRQLLVGGAALAAIGATGFMAGPALANPEQVVVRFLRTQLPGLAVGDAELQSFAKDFLRQSSWQGNKLRGALIVMDNPDVLRIAPQTVTRAFDWYSRRIVTDFLFSTNFFRDANRQLSATQYVAYADPYTIGCRNPLAQFELDTKA
jgi:hypothetical protein